MTDNFSLAALSVRGLGVRFGGIHALSDVSLDFAPGEVCGLIGPNGAGKTTLLDCLSGLRVPTCGEIWAGRQELTKLSAVKRARLGIRRTFQRPQIFGWLTVEDNVLTALEWRGGGGGFVADLLRSPKSRSLERQRREQVLEILELCGLQDESQSLAGTLPIGRVRLLEVARALVDSPEVLLLDEPTSGLEPRATERLGEIINEIRASHACTVILVEHDMHFVTSYCERIVALRLGKVLAHGPTEEVTHRSDVIEAYLG